MKNFVKYTLAATLVAGAAAQPHHQHQHQHQHAKKHLGSKVEKRGADAVVEVVVAATETVYELDGEILDMTKAQAGIDDGDLIIVGESKPTYVPPPPTTSLVSSSEPALGAKFFESKTSSSAPEPTTTSSSSTSSTSSTTSTTSSVAEMTSTSQAAKSTASSSGSSSSGGTGLNTPFPDGKVKCSEFPSDYGAVPLTWLGFGKGWSGLQFVPEYTSTSLSISKIITGIAGEDCSPGCMCSYACPPGYEKTQWPTAQGSTKESIGGLYCNDDGYLELTRSDYDVLCSPGAGGVTIQNDLDEEVSTCRTEYPGTENMVIPALASAGGSVAICNTIQDEYYKWNGEDTSGQWYVNLKGLSPEKACVWQNPDYPESAGNWAPVILGVGKASDGNTYISLFQNLPTSTAKLDFNIEITGDANSKCYFIDGKFPNGSDGCTTAMPNGGSVTIRYF